MGRNAVQKPAIVRDHHRAARKVNQGFFECPKRLQIPSTWVD
jgi:hypothetical protein